MKRALLTFTVLVPLIGSAQNPVIVDAPSKPVTWKWKEYKADLISAGTAGLPVRVGSYRGTALGTVIGHTTYDLQSNSSDPQRMFRRPDGTIAAVWTGSTSLVSGWTDRGTFYQYFDGNNWLSEPTSRIEHDRTGWPTNVILPGKELIYAHDPASDNIWAMTRLSIGSGTWNVNTSVGLTLGLWPRAAATGTNDTAHVIFANCPSTNCDTFSNAFTLYNRTTDGGLNHDITHKRLPGMDTASGYTRMGADAYGIAARGNKVAIVSAGWLNDLAVWISNDRGDNWTRTRILDFPIDNFTGNTISDTNGDAIPDTIWTSDASHSIVIGTDGVVHIFSGRMRILDETPGPGYSWFPGTNGLMYWNENMGPDNAVVLTGAMDQDGDGTLGGLGINIPRYEVSLSSMPTAAVDDVTGRITLIYSAVIENSDVFGDPSNDYAQSFRELYGMYSEDGGQTWSNPIVLTNTVRECADRTCLENVYPTAARSADGCVSVHWLRDDEPGNALEFDDPNDDFDGPDPIKVNEVVYYCFPYENFEELTPECGWTFEHQWGGRYQFTDTSHRAGWWYWDFDDLESSEDQSPMHEFDANGTYNVCLTVYNSVGNVECCQTVTVTNVGISEIFAEGKVRILPNPVTGPMVLSFTGVTAKDVQVELFDLVGRRVMAESLGDISSDVNRVVSTAGLPNGSYTVRISSGSELMSAQVEITR